MAISRISSSRRIGIAVVLALTSLVLSTVSTAQALTDSPSLGEPEAEVMALQQEWIDAEVAANVARLERVLDKRFVATYPSGKTIDRSAFIDLVVNANLAPFKVRTERIDIHGDTAVVIDISESGTTKYVWVAIKRDGAWRVISESFHRMKATTD